MLVGYSNSITRDLITIIDMGKKTDYTKSIAIYNKLLSMTKNVYHRGSYVEGIVTLKHALVTRGVLEHARVRSPLPPLEKGADAEIHAAVKAASVSRVA